MPIGPFACVIHDRGSCLRSGWCLVPLHLLLGFFSAHTALILFGVAIGPAFVIGSAIVLLAVACVPRCMHTKPGRDENVTRYTFAVGTGVAFVLVGFACGGWLFQHVRGELSDVSSGWNPFLYVCSIVVWVLFGLVYIFTYCLDGSCSGLAIRRCHKALCCGTGESTTRGASEEDQGDGKAYDDADNADVSAGNTDVRDALLPPLILKIRR